MEALPTYVDFAKTTIAPRYANVMPPGDDSYPSFSKRIDMSGTFMVDDRKIGDSTEKVPTSSGLLIWHVNRGAYSCYRYGIVPIGAKSPNGDKGLGLDLLGTANLVYRNEVPLPYQDTGDVGNVHFSPTLTSFSMCRVYAGDLRVISDNAPIGNLALNGTLSAGSVNDIRDILQAGPLSYGKQCCTPAELVQQSTVAKDGIKELPVAKGIVSVVGSDVMSEFQPPNDDYVDWDAAAWKEYKLNVIDTSNVASIRIPTGAGFNPLLANTLQATTGSNPNPRCVFSVWMSPWGTELELTNPSANPATAKNVKNINTGPINPNGVVEYTLLWGALGNENDGGAWPGGGRAPNAAFQSYRVSFRHVFGVIVPGNNVMYSVVEDQQDHIVGPGDVNTVSGVTSTSTRITASTFTFPNTLTKDVAGGGGGGMYIGTWISIMAQNIDTTDSTVAGVGNVIAAVVRYREKDVYQTGELGPVRIIRWEGVSDLQTIKVDGTVFVQCVPQGALVPFVRNKAMYSVQLLDQNVRPWIAALYNGNTPFKRNWAGDDYDEFVRQTFPGLTFEVISGYKDEKLRYITGQLNNLGNVTRMPTLSSPAANASGDFMHPRVPDSYALRNAGSRSMYSGTSFSSKGSRRTKSKRTRFQM